MGFRLPGSQNSATLVEALEGVEVGGKIAVFIYNTRLSLGKNKIFKNSCYSILTS